MRIVAIRISYLLFLCVLFFPIGWLLWGYSIASKIKENPALFPYYFGASFEEIYNRNRSSESGVGSPMRYVILNYLVNTAELLSNPQCSNSDPELIFVPKEGECIFKHVEFQATLTFDKFSRITNAPTPTQEGLIMLAGDSHTLGWGLNDNETWAAHLQRLTNIRVVNVGVSQYATYRSLARMMRHPDYAKADTIIYQFTDNDYPENNIYQRMNSADYLEYAQESRENMLAKSPSGLVSFAWAAIRAVYERFEKLANRSPKRSQSWYRGFRGPPEGQAYAMARIFDRFLPDMYGKRVIFVYIPSKPRKILPEFPAAIRRHIAGVEVLDDVEFQQHHYLPIDGHMNASGARFFAEKLARYLQTDSTEVR